MVKVAVLVAIAATAMPAQAINKCTGADGKVVYQEQPCSVAQRAAVVDIAPTQEQVEQRERRKAEERAERERRDAENARLSAAAAESERQQRKLNDELAKHSREWDQKWARAQAACGKKLTQYPTVGMSESDFLNCTTEGLFSKFSVNRTETAGSVSKQYVFSGSATMLSYVYVRNGVVTAIQR